MSKYPAAEWQDRLITCQYAFALNLILTNIFMAKTIENMMSPTVIFLSMKTTFDKEIYMLMANDYYFFVDILNFIFSEKKINFEFVEYYHECNRGDCTNYKKLNLVLICLIQ